MGKILLKKKILRSDKKTIIRFEMTKAHEEYNNALLRRALYKTNDLETSQDLVQSTFLKTLLYLQKGGKIHLMRGFLNHILNDLIVDEYRARNTKATSLDKLQASGFDPSCHEYERKTDCFDGEKMILLIPKLSKKYEVVMRLRYVKGLSIKEIALITDQSENTVSVQVHRGVAKLKKLYEAQTPV